MVALAVRLAGLALALPAQGASARPHASRWYEVDVAPDRKAGADAPLATTCGLSIDELATELAAQQFDGAILWLAPELASLAPELPHEPHARAIGDAGELAAADAQARMKAAVAALRERRLDVAIGIAEPPELAELARGGTASFRTLWIDGATGTTGANATTELPRATRPAVRSLLWCDPRWNRPASAFAVSTRLLAVTPESLRPLQARLDLASFGRAGLDGARDAAARAQLDGAAFKRLLAQSRIASEVAARVAGSTPERLDVWTNEWSGPPPPELPIALRRAPPWLDLEETLLSPGGFARGGDDAPAVADAPIEKSPGDAVTSDDAAAAGILAAPVIDAFARLCAARRVAALQLGRFLLLAQAGDHDALVESLKRCDEAAAGLGEFAAPWRSGLAGDQDLVHGLEPWRVTSVVWQLHFLDRPGPPITVLSHAVDDERALGFAGPAADAIGGERLPLSRLVVLDPARPLRLRTELPLADPRAARLEIEGGGRVTLRVNGADQLGPYDATAQRLITTLPLAAGRNVVEIDLAPIAGASDPTVTLLLLPHRIEGITLEPRRALRTKEPVVRLHDPGAIAEESLVWPEGRNVGSEHSGSADLPFEPQWSGRTDLWIHVLRGGTGDGTLEIALDERPAQSLVIPGGERWQWLRLPAPLPSVHGAHRLVLTFRSPGTRVDAVTCLETGVAFPHRPAGDGTLTDAAWRFDPLGAGLVVDLPPLAAGDLFGRAFQADKSANYQVFVWLRGRDPLQSGETAEVDLTAPSTRMRFVVPCGTPYEEWVAVGSVSLTADERVELRARGRGALTRVAFIR